MTTTEIELRECLKRIVANILPPYAMTREQEKGFERHPELESWRLTLSGLIVTARNDAENTLKNTQS